MPADALALVQFLHPGLEHGPDSPGHRSWNKGIHRRKFLLADATYRDGAAAKEGRVTFWGEWEAPSRLLATFPRDGDLPRFLHEPILGRPDDFRGLQNTDPFVFGPRFLYTGCQQHTNHGRTETQLRRLTRGSVILFGSCRADRFVLDTVFVVADHIDHRLEDHREALVGAVPEEYWTVTLGPWYSDGVGIQSFRLYRGATLQKPVAGMYSFAPCLPAGATKQRFARPDVELQGAITPNLRQGKKITRFGSLEQARNVWEQVLLRVEDTGLAMATTIAMPAEESVRR